MTENYGTETTEVMEGQKLSQLTRNTGKCGWIVVEFVGKENGGCYFITCKSQRK